LKFITVFLILLTLASCRTTRIVSDKTTTDSVTTLLTRPITLTSTGDSVTGTYQIDSFYRALYTAKTGDIITHKKGKKVSYAVKKTGENAFDIEAVAEPIDTTITVYDRTTFVRKTSTKILKEEPSTLSKIALNLKNGALLTGFIYGVPRF
jgi:hypothetical protein